ncbi:MAG: hypothetical protein AAF639_45830 [Chloroflexota bacterium]
MLQTAQYQSTNYQHGSGSIPSYTLNNIPDNLPTGQPLFRFLHSQPWVLFLLLSSVTVLSTTLVLNYPVAIAIVLCGLLAVGIGQSLLLPKPYNQIGGFLVVSGWILSQQSLGLWQPETVMLNLLYLVGLSTTIVTSIYYRQQWTGERSQLEKLDKLESLLEAGEEGTGIVTRSVAELRLQEEIERAQSSNMPVGVLLFGFAPPLGRQVSPVDADLAAQAAIRRLVNNARSYDLAFHYADNQYGIVLPARDGNTLRRDALTMWAVVRETTFHDQNGHPQSVLSHIQFRLGWATSQSEGTSIAVNSAPLLLQMAEDNMNIHHASQLAHSYSLSPLMSLVQNNPQHQPEYHAEYQLQHQATYQDKYNEHYPEDYPEDYGAEPATMPKNTLSWHVGTDDSVTIVGDAKQ